MGTNTLKMPFSRAKMLKYTAIVLFVLLLGIDMFVDSGAEQGGMHYFGKAFGLFNMFIFGPLLLVCLLLLVRRSKGLVFTDKGFQDDSFFGLGGHVHWSEVEDIERVVLHGYKFIKVRLKDPNEFIAGSSGVLKSLYRINYKYYGTPLFISSLLLSTSFDRLYEQVQIQWRAAKWQSGQHQISETKAEEHGLG